MFIRLLKNKSDKNYWTYISELRKRKSKDIFDQSIILIESEIAKERIIGIDILAQFGYPRLRKKLILKFFFKLLKNEKDEKVLKSLFYGIGHNNENLTNKQIDVICSFKNHKNTEVKYSLVFALLTKEEPKAIETLIELTRDQNPRIRDWATFGIGTQIETDNKIIRETLWKRCNDKDENTKFEAILGLAKRKEENIKEVLKNELQKIDEFNPLISEAIEELNDKEFIFLLEEKIKKNRFLKKINDDYLLETLEKLKQSE